MADILVWVVSVSKRFVVIVLDGFGVGAMDDVSQVRPQDIGANTAGHILALNQNIQWDTLFQLGLMNALGYETEHYKMNPMANYGTSNLAHFGGDTFFGHQEILGTKPMKPVLEKLADHLNDVETDLLANGYYVQRFAKEGKQLLCVNECMFIGDNLETDSGQAINVTGSFELTTFETIQTVGRLVRKHFKVSRVIAFGGEQVTFLDLLNAIEVREDYIGVNAPNSKVYNHGYQVLHIGYGVNYKVQVPYVLDEVGIKTYLYGKVADIVENRTGESKPGVDTNTLFDYLIEDIQKYQTGFFCLNVQETDLAGHAQDPIRYSNRVNVSSQCIQQVIQLLGDEDILIVMADHGNDPTSNSSKHSREKVPLLIYKQGVYARQVGLRNTLADVGATVAEYFDTKLTYGTSFLNILKRF